MERSLTLLHHGIPAGATFLGRLEQQAHSTLQAGAVMRRKL
jgi:hypothetical protein